LKETHEADLIRSKHEAILRSGGRGGLVVLSYFDNVFLCRYLHCILVHLLVFSWILNM